MKNIRLAVEVVNHILDNPDLWDQYEWHCGTTHCFAGHVQIMGGRAENAKKCFNDLIELLGVCEEDADWLTNSRRPLSDLHAYVKSYVNGTPYFDRYGYDPHGYDRHNRYQEGYDCYGYDRNGYDRRGYNQEGYFQSTRLPRLTVE